MKFRSVVTALAMVATVCVPGAVYATTTASVHAPVHAIFGKPHTVTLNLRNDNTQSITVKAGDKEMTLESGKTQTVKLSAGEKIVAVTASADHAAGELLATVNQTMDQATIGIK